MKLPEHSQRPAGTLFLLLLLVLVFFLLFQIDAETRYSAKGKLFAQPRFWPAVGVGGMALFGLAHLALTFRHRVPGWTTEVITWLRAFEYYGWFMIYVVVVPIIGYLPATLIFMPLLALRQGYRETRTWLLAALVGFGIVLIFKTGLAVKIPGGALYEYLPGALRNFLIVNF